MSTLTQRILVLITICISMMVIMVGVVAADPTDDHLQYKTVPYELPTFTVTVPAADVADGYIFMTPHTGARFIEGVFPFLMIVDNNGEPVYYEQITNEWNLFDFHPHETTNQLTYFTRTMPAQDVIAGQIRDSSYNPVGSIGAVGYAPNEQGFHEVIMTDEGTIITMLYARRTVDMSGIVEGGLPNATIVDLVIQENDPQDNSVLMEWNSADHTLITETSSLLHPDLAVATLDYAHGNAIEIDTDNNLLVMVRDLNQVVKINRETGETMWRLGGDSSDFTVVGDTQMFNLAHSPRRLANGNIQIFDNTRVLTPTYSRLVDYAVDEVNMTVEQVWEWKHPGNIYASFAGNVSEMPNGNRVIGWGGSGFTSIPGETATADVTEISTDGTIQFELDLGAPYISYRAYRQPWVGNPTQPPALVSEYDGTDIMLYYSWNGATEVAEYNVYGGTDAANLTLVETKAKTRFEDSTAIVAPPQNTTYYYQVVPVDAAGTELLASDTIEVITTPTTVGMGTTSVTNTTTAAWSLILVAFALMMMSAVTVMLKR